MRERTEAEPSKRSVAGDDESSSSGALRKALLGLGLVGLAYVAARRAGSGETELSPEEVRETVDDAVSGGEGGPSFGNPAASEVDSEPLPTEGASTAEIEERAEENVTEEPAPPGEMAVDEDIVEEIVDDEGEGAPADEAASGGEGEERS